MMKNAILLLALFATLGAQAQMQPPQSGGAQLPAVRHLVYRFGYNTKAADSGQGTGTTTINIVGPAKDGGFIVNATDFWWNTPRPRQTYTCEVYQNGSVNCAQPPHAISPIQAVIVPLLAPHYFAALSSSQTATWKQNYNVTATFAPAASSGFLGQVYTWNGAYTLHGKGTVPNDAPLILVRSEGALKQQGGRHITANQKMNIAYDPRINAPAVVFQDTRFVPQRTTNNYTVELRLTKTGNAPGGT